MGRDYLNTVVSQLFPLSERGFRGEELSTTCYHLYLLYPSAPMVLYLALSNLLPLRVPDFPPSKLTWSHVDVTDTPRGSTEVKKEPTNSHPHPLFRFLLNFQRLWSVYTITNVPASEIHAPGSTSKHLTDSLVDLSRPVSPSAISGPHISDRDL